jgi:hypothetical protein
MVRSVAQRSCASRTIEAPALSRTVLVAHPSRRPRCAWAPQDEVEFVACSRCQTATRQRPVFWSGDGCACLFLCPSYRGSGAPTGASTNSRRACETCVHAAGPMRSGVDIPAQDAAPSGAPLQRFWAWDRASGCGGIARSRRISPPFFRTSSSHRRQPHLVGADGDPSLPEMACEAHPQAPRPLHQQTPLADAPDERDKFSLSVFIGACQQNALVPMRAVNIGGKVGRREAAVTRASPLEPAKENHISMSSPISRLTTECVSAPEET